MSRGDLTLPGWRSRDEVGALGAENSGPPASDSRPWGKCLLEADSQSCGQAPEGLLSHRSAGWGGVGAGTRVQDCADIDKRRNISHKELVPAQVLQEAVAETEFKGRRSP